MQSEAFLPSRALARWVTGMLRGTVPACLNGATQDSRQVVPGALYVALRGERFDGHNFVAAALAAGAGAALVEKAWAQTQTTPWPLICVDDTRRALLQAAAAWRQTHAARLVGLTGSAGKTTTKEMLACLLRAVAPTVATPGNYNNEIGLPLSLLGLYPQATYGVFEVGTNHPGEIAMLACVLEPEIAVITSIGSAHIENFASRAAIVAEKGALLEHVRAGGHVVLAREVEEFQQLKMMASGRVVTTTWRDEAADYQGRLLDTTTGAIEVWERATDVRVQLCSGLPGAHNASNLLLAYAVARLCGVSSAVAPAALKNLRLPGMRWERLQHGGVEIINDAYNANPQSMQAALETFAQWPCSGRRLVVLGDMLELGTQSEYWHRKMGRVVARLRPDYLCTVGTAANWLVDEALKDGLPAAHVARFNDAPAAGAALATLARAGDVVLLKGSRGMRLEGVLDGWTL